MEPLPTSYYVGALGTAVLLCLVLPIAVVIAVRRTSLRARAVAVGVLTFAVSQLLTRLPAVILLQLLLTDWLAASKVNQWIWLVALSLSAGLFEESARALGFRWLLKPLPRTMATPVGLGLGHAGLEAMALVGATHLITVATFYWVSGLETLPVPPEAQEAVIAQRDALAAMGALGPLASLYERVVSGLFHITLSVLVFHGVREGKTVAFVALAILLHGVGNLGTIAAAGVLWPGTLGGIWVTEGVLSVIVALTALLVWWIVRGSFEAQGSIATEQ